MPNRNLILLGQAHIVCIDHQLTIYDIVVTILYSFIFFNPILAIWESGGRGTVKVLNGENGNSFTTAKRLNAVVPSISCLERLLNTCAEQEKQIYNRKLEYPSNCLM